MSRWPLCLRMRVIEHWILIIENVHKNIYKWGLWVIVLFQDAIHFKMFHTLQNLLHQDNIRLFTNTFIHFIYKPFFFLLSHVGVYAMVRSTKKNQLKFIARSKTKKYLEIIIKNKNKSEVFYYRKQNLRSFSTIWYNFRST